MAVNLSRNTKVYFTTLQGEGATGYTDTNTWEIQVMDGYTFTQGTEQQVIQLNEAGPTPNRGQRAFNTQLNPVDWNFGAYIRPTKLTAAPNTVTAVERVLWNAVAGAQALVAPTAYASLTSLTRTGTTATAVLTSPGAALSAGQVINIYGVAEADWNGEFKATTVSPSNTTGVAVTVTYEYATAPTATTAGSLAAAKAATCPWYETTSSAAVTFLGSNFHQLASFALIFKVDNVYYKINNCAINQAEIQFDIAGISQITWNGFGTSVKEITNATALSQIGTIAAANTTADFITNKLSTVTFQSNIGGGGSSYSVPITGGNITINNNLEYLTPEILGTVNSPIGYFTGARSISGSLNAYLRTGNSGDTGDLLSDILADSATATETKYKVQVEVGGVTNTPRVEFLMNGCQVQVPTVDIQDVVSTTINFTAQGYTGANYDIEKTNDMKVTYYGKVPT